MVGSELAPMIERILIGFSGLQIPPGYHNFSGVSENLYMLEKHSVFCLEAILISQMICATL